jgi:hypothetical protein
MPRAAPLTTATRPVNLRIESSPLWSICAMMITRNVVDLQLSALNRRCRSRAENCDPHSNK